MIDGCELCLWLGRELYSWNVKGTDEMPTLVMMMFLSAAEQIVYFYVFLRFLSHFSPVQRSCEVKQQVHFMALGYFSLLSLLSVKKWSVELVHVGNNPLNDPFSALSSCVVFQ